MKEKNRVVAIIVKNHKLLLVKGSNRYKEFWTPGGKREEGESDLECLSRELIEELTVKVVSAKFFGEYVDKSAYDTDSITRSNVYLVEISGDINVSKEIKGYTWMSRKEFDEGKYPLTPTTRDRIIPDLIKAGYF